MKKTIAALLVLIIICTTMFTSCQQLRDMMEKFSGTLDVDVSAGNTTINNTINNNYGNNETNKSEVSDDKVGEENSKDENEVFGKFDEINTKNSYIGYGIDIINSSAVTSNDVKVTYPIFDNDKLVNENLLKSNGNYSLFETIESDTMRGFTENMSNSSSNTAGVNIAAEGKVFGITAKASASFSNGLTTKFTKTSNSVESQYFLEVIADNQSYWLALQSTETRYKEILSEEFKSDLYNASVTPEELFKKYGTHLLTSVVMGGNICMYYTLYSYDSNTSLEDYAEISSLVKSNIEVSYGTKASIGTGVETSYTDAYTYTSKASEKGIQVDSKIICAGGGNFGIIDEQTLYDNYHEWQKSLAQNPVLIGVKDSNSLYPIWKLLDMSIEGAEERYNELYGYFQEYGTASFDKLCESYEIKDTYTVDFNTGMHGVEITSLYGIKKNTNISEYKPEITRDGYILEGWYKDVKQTVKFNFETDTVVSDMTLYAKWQIKDVKYKYEASFSPNNGYNDVTLGRNDSHTQKISTGFIKKDLIDNGYETITVTVTVDCKETNWICCNYAQIQVLSYDGTAKAYAHISTEDINNTWESRTVTLVMSVNDLSDNGEFSIRYSTVDGGGTASDGWILGSRTIKVVATKN